MRDIGDSRSDADDRLVESGQRVGELAGCEARAPPRARLPLARFVPHVAAGLGLADEPLCLFELDGDRPLGALEEHGDATRMQHVEGARLQLRGGERARNSRRLTRLRDKRPVAGGRGWRRRQTRAMNASRPREPQTSLPRSYPATFFTTLPPAFAIVPSASTSVTPSTRSRTEPKR